MYNMKKGKEWYRKGIILFSVQMKGFVKFL